MPSIRSTACAVQLPADESVAHAVPRRGQVGHANTLAPSPVQRRKGNRYRVRGSAFAFQGRVFAEIPVSWTELLRRTWREIVDDDAGKGAGVGATVGVLAGGRRARHNQAARAQQAEATKAQATTTYYRAYSACMQGRGYTVQ